MSHDPQRFRALMPVTWLEKSWGLIVVTLYIENRVSSQVLGLGLIDLLLGILFVGAYFTTTRIRVFGVDELNRRIQ